MPVAGAARLRGDTAADAVRKLRGGEGERDRHPGAHALLRQKKEMPFAVRRRQQYWTADARYVKGHKLGGRAYVVNHSRAILSSALTRTQDLASYLSVLHAAVASAFGERYGSPEALVRDPDGGGVFRARQARVVYEALGIAKHEIERGRPW